MIKDVIKQQMSVNKTDDLSDLYFGEYLKDYGLIDE